jgi:acyl-coenzyme A synthetase/AMP-(fatty) acid ligase
MINLCEDRYLFIAAYAAALSAGHVSLFPPSRVEQVVAEVEQANSNSYRFDDGAVLAALERDDSARSIRSTIDRDSLAMIGYTSGSTGQPKANAKYWRSIAASTAWNAQSIRTALRLSNDEPAWLLATVPPQHMYGMELSVLLPLIGGMAVHAGRPLFPADIAVELASLPEPRVLVSTPVHLRAIVESEQAFPRASLIISATAPLSCALAQAVENKLGGRMLEMFGSTETCVIATRFTAVDEAWTAYPGISLSPLEDTTRVDAPWFVEPVVLQDILQMTDANRFVVRGRHSDMIEVAGKRASLADLTRRLLAIEGVRDAAVFQPEPVESGGIARVAAVVVAPTLTSRQIIEALSDSVDSAFLPRPLVLVPSLPRNELGKLPRNELIALVRKKRVADSG